MSRPAILDEDRLSLEEARALLGTGGKPCNFTTAWRAVTQGHLLPDGTKLRLEAVRIGGQWVTSKQAIERYVVAMTEAWTDQHNDSPMIATRQQKLCRLATAEAELAVRGI